MKTSTALTAALLLTLTASASAAPINYGDFSGATVMYLDVTETAISPGDSEPLWGTPTLPSSNSLEFKPTTFSSSATNGSSDTTAASIDTTIMTTFGATIDSLLFTESGQAILSPLFASPANNASVAFSGTASVIANLSGSITTSSPVNIAFTGTFTPSATFALPDDNGTNDWTGTASIDIASIVPDATKIQFSLTNTLTTNTDTGGGFGIPTAEIFKDAATLSVTTTPSVVPLPLAAYPAIPILIAIAANRIKI